jgi:tetratricopeptide (TPR) repeat protein
MDFSSNPDATEFVAVIPERHFLIALEPLDLNGKQWDIAKTEKTIGRHVNNDIVIYEKSVSSTHAKIQMLDNQKAQLDDLRSKNATFVNGKKIKSAVLYGGEFIQIGKTLCRYIPHSYVFRPDDRPKNPNKNRIPGGATTVISFLVIILVLIMAGKVFQPERESHIEIGSDQPELFVDADNPEYDVLLNKALSLMDEHNWSEASTYLEQIPDTFSNDLRELRRTCAREMFSHNRYNDVIDAVDHNDWVLAQRYESQIDENSHYKVKADEYIRRHKDNYLSDKLKIVQTLIQNSQLDESDQKLTLLAEIDPDNETIKTLRTDIQNRRRQIARRTTQQRARPTQRPDSVPDRTQQQHGEQIYRSAVSSYMQGNWDLARRQFEQVRHSYTGNGQAEPRRIMHLWKSAHDSYNRGLDLMNSKDFEQSLDHLQTFFQFNQLIDPAGNSRPVATVMPVLEQNLREVRSYLDAEEYLRAAQLLRKLPDIDPIRSGRNRLETVINEKAVDTYRTALYTYEIQSIEKAVRLYDYVMNLTSPDDEYYQRASERKQRLQQSGRR